MRISLLTVVAVFVTSVASAQVNLTGTWQPKYWTTKMALQQDGSRVWGHGGAQDFWFRGHWDGARLIIVANNFDPKRPKSPCRPRGVMAVSGQDRHKPDDDLVGMKDARNRFAARGPGYRQPQAIPLHIHMRRS